MSAHRRIGLAAQILILTALAWVAFVACGLVFDGTWPHARPGVSTSEAWQNFVAVAAIVEFLVIKAWLMARRTYRWTALGASLVAANVAFAVLYAWLITASLWPALGLKRVHLDAIVGTVTLGGTAVLRWGLLAVLAWSVWELLRSPDPDPD